MLQSLPKIIVHPGSLPVVTIAFGVLLAILTPVELQADYETWNVRGGTERRLIHAELEAFDFETKEAVIRDRDGEQHRYSTDTLDSEGRIRLLLSPVFVRSFPDGMSKEKLWFVVFAVGVPSAFLLAGFFLSAVILMKSVNPVRAVVAWVGAVVLGAFLVSFYVFLSGRSPPEAVKGVIVVGMIAVAILLSLYVSIIYRTTLVKGFKMLLLHVAAALLLFAAAVVFFKVGLAEDQAERILDGSIFQRVGLTDLL